MIEVDYVPKHHNGSLTIVTRGMEKLEIVCYDFLSKLKRPSNILGAFTE